MSGMNVDDLFPSNYVKAGDLNGQEVTVTISNVVKEKVGRQKEELPVIYFAGRQKGLCCNRTNAKTISASLGKNTSSWINNQIVLFPTTVDFQGGQVPAIRVRVPVQQMQSPPVMPPQLPPQTGGGNFPVDVPFYPIW
jgi:hypothetical protein